MLVFRWRDSTAPLVTDVLQSSGSVYSPFSSINWVNFKKIQVLRDEVLSIKDYGGDTDNVVFSVEMNPGSQLIELPAAGTGVQPVMNGIYILFISDDIIPTNPLVTFFCTVRYTDA